MTKPLPKWVTQRYSILWKTFNKRDFNYSEASKLLQEKNEALVSIVISELKKHGWLTVKLDPGDSRKRIYTLKSPEEAINEIE